MAIEDNEPGDSGQEGDVPPQAIAWMIGPDIALVLGDEATAESVGEPLSAFSPQMARAVLAGNAALQGLVGAGKASGQLVRLTADSAKMLRAYGETLDRAGSIYAVTRNGSGQITKHLSFTRMRTLPAAAAAGSALGALALQLQLEHLTRQLTEVQQAVGGIQDHLVDELVSAIENDLSGLTGAYQALHDTGTVSDVDWPGITHYLTDAQQRVRQVERKLLRGIGAIQRVGPDKDEDRSSSARLKEVERAEAEHRPLLWLGLFLKAQQAVMVGEALRVYRLVAAGDPNVDVLTQSSEQRLRETLTAMSDLCDQVENAIAYAGTQDLSEANRRLPPQLSRRLDPLWQGLPASVRRDRSSELAQRVGDLRARIAPVIERIRTVVAASGRAVTSSDGRPSAP